MRSFVAFAATLASTLALAKLSSRDATPLTADAIETYVPYAQFARAAYCVNNSTTWNCGGEPTPTRGESWG